MNTYKSQLCGQTPAELFNVQITQQRLVIIEFKKDYEIHCRKKVDGIDCRVLFTGHEHREWELIGDIFIAYTYTGILKKAREIVKARVETTSGA